MQLGKEIMEVLERFGYLNIEKESKRKLIENLIQRYSTSKEDSEKQYSDFLKKTLYVHKVNYVLRQDEAKVLECPVCHTKTNTLVKLYSNSRESACEKCIEKELLEVKEKTKDNIKNEVKDEKGSSKAGKKV